MSVGHRHAGTMPAVVDNPYYSADHPESRTNPRTVETVVSMREWSVKTLALDEGQKAAAQRFCNSWATVQGMRTASSCFTERIDSGRLATSFADHSLAAAADLRHCRILLGEHGYALVGKICGDGYHIRDLYRTRRERDTASDLLRIHLTSLAAMWTK